MFRPDGLTKAEWDQVLVALRTSGRWRTSVVMHDLDDNPYRKLGRILDGQVQGDAKGRMLSMTLHDPDRKMRDVEGIQSGRYIIRPSYQVAIPSRARAVDIPLITAPVDTCSRADNVVTITARGKASLHQKEPGDPYTVPKGVKKTEAIKRIAEQAGELRSHMDIPDRPATLGNDLTVGALQTYWEHERQLAGQLDLTLFYDQAGRLRARAPMTAPALKPTPFQLGDNGFLTSMPVVTVENDTFHNEVWFNYGDKGKEHLVVKAPPDHPLSAQSLAWHGSLRREILHVTQTKVKRRATALRIAQAILDRDLLHTVSVTAEAFPFPFIEPGDLYRFNSRDYSDVTSVTSWSLPLSPGTAMTLGWSDLRSRGVGR